MNQDELRETLRQLHAELAQAEQIDTQSLELLNQLTADVDRIVLGKQPNSVGDQPIPAEGREFVVFRSTAQHGFDVRNKTSSRQRPFGTVERRTRQSGHLGKVTEDA